MNEMQTNGGRRAEAWGQLWKGGWFFRLLFVTIIFMMINMGVQVFTSASYRVAGISDIQDVITEVERAKAEKRSAKYEFNRATMLHVAGATAFEIFIFWTFIAIGRLGTAKAYLRAARHEDRAHAYDGIFSGFRAPFGNFWLLARSCLQIALWTLLFIFPAFIAAYRYALAWYLKSDHPDWGAGKCLRESGRLMKGRKWDMFVFHCSYWKQGLAVMAPAILAYGSFIAAIFMAVYSDGAMMTASARLAILALALFAFAMFIAVFVVSAVVAAQFRLGNAIYYRELVHAE